MAQVSDLLPSAEFLPNQVFCFNRGVSGSPSKIPFPQFRSKDIYALSLYMVEVSVEKDKSPLYYLGLVAGVGRQFLIWGDQYIEKNDILD